MTFDPTRTRCEDDFDASRLSSGLVLDDDFVADRRTARAEAVTELKRRYGLWALDQPHCQRQLTEYQREHDKVFEALQRERNRVREANVGVPWFFGSWDPINQPLPRVHFVNAADTIIVYMSPSEAA